jgi:periplasmic divalent cation tolerance protein
MDSMTDIIQIEWTAGSIDEARKISRYLVQERLAAQAGIIPWIEKITLLNGQLDTSQESKIFLTAKLQHFEAIKKVILDNSSYQIPEITYRKLDYVNEAYLDWMAGHEQHS